MKDLVSKTLAAGLALGLWAAPAAAAAEPAGQANAAVIGTTVGAARRKALLKAIEDWKTMLPDDSKDPMAPKYLDSLHQIKDKATGLKAGEALAPVEQDFETWKQQLLTELYHQNKERFFNDPQRFQDFMQKRLDAMAAIRDAKKRVPSQSKRLNELKAKIESVPDAVTFNKIYDNLNARSETSNSAVRAVAFAAPAPKPSAAKTVSFTTPERLSAPPAPGSLGGPTVPAKAELTSFNPEPASGSVLSGFIRNLRDAGATARRYADKVADAIVSYSRKLNLDERLEAAFVWAESAFNPHATSSVGAMGLGQLMPGTAAGLGVRNAYDINQNVRGSTRFVKGLMDHFSSDDEMRYTQGLYAWGKTQVRSGRPAGEVWKDIFERTPMGVKNAIAAYNAGQGAVEIYGHGRYDRLPVSRTKYAENNNVGYWQTIHYVPTVLRHYFDVMLATPTNAAAPATIAA